MTIFDKAAVMSDKVNPPGIGPNNCVSCGVYCMPSGKVELDGVVYCHACAEQKKKRDGGKIVQLEGKGHATGAFARAIVVDDAVFTEDMVEKAVQAPIGESEPTERDDSVNIPLALQKKLLHATFYDTMLWLQELLEDDDFMQDIEKMCEARLEQAHPKWGSTMYGWTSERRLRAIMEEFSDIFNYKSSEV